MSYIEPNSRIEFFTDLGLSQDYNDTLYFVSTAAKDAYFSDNNLPLAHVDKCYYTREHRGFVRVELPMSTLIHAQYMRFKNTSFENKWWYAFVTDVNYINNNTTEVQFELDPMMTWMGEFSLDRCYIERQHSTTDEIGDNIIDEPVNIGTYVASDVRRSEYFDEWTYLVFFSPNVLGTITESDVNADLGIYSGLSVIAFPDDATAVSRLDFYRIVENIFGSVQMVAYVPKDFIPYLANVSGFDDPTRGIAPVIKVFSIPRSSVSDGVDGYTPKNNKLYTAPYNMLTVFNTEGEELSYRYEFFTDNSSHSIDFQIAGSINEKSQIRLAPYSYKGQSINNEEVMGMYDFPYATWTSDTFMAYMAQTLSDSPVRLLASGKNEKNTSDSTFSSANESERTMAGVSKPIIDKATGIGSAVLAGASAGSSLMVSQSVEIGANIGKAIFEPNSVKGGSTPDVTTLLNQKDFWFVRKTINSQNARVIDDYFNMFGYAQKIVDTPNMNARPYWTYVKTIQCKVNCNCPASDIDFIERCFNRGIRFWKNHELIGRYDLDNSPV